MMETSGQISRFLCPFLLSLSSPPLLDNLSRTVSIISGPVDFVSFRIWRKTETEGRNSSLDRVAYVDEQRRWKRKEEKGRLLIRESTHSFAIHRSNDIRCSCIARFFPLFRVSRPFVRSNHQFLFRLHSVFLSPYLPLSLFFNMNFDKEPFFFTRKAPYFPLPAVPLPVEHLKEAIRGFRGSRRFVTLTLNLTRQKGI